MGFWGTLGKIGLGATGVAGAPFTGGASLWPTIGAIGGSIGTALINRSAAKGAGTTSQTTQATRQFDPYTMGLMRDLQGQGAAGLQDYMRDPWQAGFFQNQLGRSQEQIAQQGRTGMQGTLNLLGQSSGGVGNLPAYLMSEAGRQGRATSRAQSEAYSGLLSNAEGLRRGAFGAALGYQPLETGRTQTGGTSQGVPSLWSTIAGAGLGGAIDAIKKRKPWQQEVPSPPPWEMPDISPDPSSVGYPRPPLGSYLKSPFFGGM